MSAAASIRAVIASGNEGAARALLQQANDAYYGSGSSDLTDAEFDALQAEYTARFGMAVRTAPTMVRGRSDRQAGVPHDWPLLSGWLAKTSGKGEMLEWALRRRSQVADGSAVGSPKWDGMSVVVTYDRHGRVQRALTRGDDGLGVDVTRMFAGEQHFRDYDAEVRFGVKYEVVMTWSAVEQMSADLGRTYKNPRNTVAGIVSSDESASRRKYVTLVPLDVAWDGMGPGDGRMARLALMQSLFAGATDEEGNPAGPAPFCGNGDAETPLSFWTANEPSELEAIYDEVLSWRDREDFEFMIDGVVFELVDDGDIARLGGPQSDCPDYATATKFPSMVGRTTVTGVDFDLGNTGRLTPVVNYVPITLDGRTFSRTSISNFVRFDALRLAVGTPIIVEIRGDVKQCASAG